MNVFLQELSKVNKGKKLVLIMDGASWHKSDKLNIPKNIQSGKKMRLKGKGFPGTPNGDFYAVIKIVIPNDNQASEELWKQLAESSDFNPRDKFS